MSSNAGKPIVIVTGMMFFEPVAGVVLQVLHYLRGLRQLGFQPIYVEHAYWWFYDADSGERSPAPDGAVRVVRRALAPYDLEDCWSLRRVDGNGDTVYDGIPESEVRRSCREAVALLNVTGTQRLDDELLECPNRLYIESDPLVAQIDAAIGDEETVSHLDAHDVLFTFGQTIHHPRFPVPLAPYEWHPTRQAVALDMWQTDEPPNDSVFTSVTSWFNDNKNREWNGVTYYWTKGTEFEKFLAAADRHPGRFELAVGTGNGAEQVLESAGWGFRDAAALSNDIDRYRSYIQGSYGEFTVARHQYVESGAGWFSDRSACYLAAGRPVITQETGFSDVLPTGEGLFAFLTLDDVAAAIEAIDRSPAAHQEAARELAHEYFAAERVISDMFRVAGV